MASPAVRMSHRAHKRPQAAIKRIELAAYQTYLLEKKRQKEGRLG
jgi:hypothetical protein